jgi:hypothetical protein
LFFLSIEPAGGEVGEKALRSVLENGITLVPSPQFHTSSSYISRNPDSALNQNSRDAEI